MKKLILIPLLVIGIIQCAEPSCSMDVQEESLAESLPSVDENIRNVIERITFAGNVSELIKWSAGSPSPLARLSSSALEKTITWYENILPAVKNDQKLFGLRSKELGLAYLFKDPQSEKTIEHLQNALTIHQHEQLPYGHILENIASAYVLRRESQKALETLERAVPVLQKEKLSCGYALLLLHAGYVEQKDHAKAQESWPVALEALHQENLPYARLLIEMGCGAMKKREPQEAKGWHEKAKTALEREQALFGKDNKHAIDTCKRRIKLLESFNTNPLPS